MPRGDIRCLKKTSFSIFLTSTPFVVLVGDFAVGKLQCMRNDKYPQFTVRLSDKSIQQLEKLALVRSRSRSEIVREAIHYYSKLYSLSIIDSSEPKH